jgi:hypothetical protein
MADMADSLDFRCLLTLSGLKDGQATRFPTREFQLTIQPDWNTVFHSGAGFVGFIGRG